MKNRTFILSGFLIAVLLFGIWWFWKANPPMPGQSVAVVATNIAAPKSTNVLQANSIPSSGQATNMTNDLAAANKAYEQGLMSKEDLIKAVVAEQNKQPQDFYGKVIDQHGEPVAGVTVTGSLIIDTGEDLKTKEIHTTQTDAEGLFQFTGGEGSEIAVVVNKAGYEMGDRGEGYKGPVGKKTSPTDRAILTMWKLKGAEPMVHTRIEVGIPCDGTQRNFDLLTGHRVENGGDLTVSFARDPVDIVRGKPFDWKLILGVPEGGLLEIADLYPNEAPADGYQPNVQIDMPATTNKWTPDFNGSYYLESRGEKIFGRVTVRLTGNYEPPPTHFEIDAYLNPAGSRNLEIDSSKVTNVGNGHF